MGEGKSEKVPLLKLPMSWSRVRALFPQVAPVVKKLPANAEDTRDTGSIPGLGISPGGGHENPLHYSCGDKGAWQATVHGVAKRQTRTK